MTKQATDWRTPGWWKNQKMGRKYIEQSTPVTAIEAARQQYKSYEEAGINTPSYNAWKKKHEKILLG